MCVYSSSHIYSTVICGQLEDAQNYKPAEKILSLSLQGHWQVL